jgi:type IV secretion system protein VirB10
MFRLVRTAFTLLVTLAPAFALDQERDFSGKWVYDAAHSNTRSISSPAERFLTITARENAIQCSTTAADGTTVEWTLSADGPDAHYRIGAEKRNSKVKWEGDALLVNTIVTGPQDYSMLDRWYLSRDHSMLTIERQIQQNGRDSEGMLRFYREGAAVSANPPSSPAPPPAVASNNVRPALQTPPPPPAPTQLIVRAGTRIPLSLRNAIDTKHSHEGDRVYLDTLYPVVVDNRIVVPRGSYVIGTLTKTKPAGVVAGKGELYIRFDSLTLPNGVTRDFRSRLVSADTAHGNVDRQEGTITGERDKSGEAKTTAEGAGIGAGIGGLAGAAAGHPLGGVGIGAAAGAAVGLASVMHKHRADVTLPSGTTVEMLLDRDLAYQRSELSQR